MLKKPFEALEVLQLAHALGRKWAIRHELVNKLGELDRVLHARNQEIEAAASQLQREMRERERLERERRLAGKRRPWVN